MPSAPEGPPRATEPNQRTQRRQPRATAHGHKRTEPGALLCEKPGRAGGMAPAAGGISAGALPERTPTDRPPPGTPTGAPGERSPTDGAAPPAPRHAEREVEEKKGTARTLILNGAPQGAQPPTAGRRPRRRPCQRRAQKRRARTPPGGARRWQGGASRPHRRSAAAPGDLLAYSHRGRRPCIPTGEPQTAAREAPTRGPGPRRGPIGARADGAAPGGHSPMICSTAAWASVMSSITSCNWSRARRTPPPIWLRSWSTTRSASAALAAMS